MTNPETTAKPGINIDIKIVFILVLILAVYLPVLIDLVVDWYQDDNYSHGFLILPIAAWLIWRKRNELAETPTKMNNLGLLMAIGSLFLLIAGTAGAEYFTARVSFVGLLFSLCLYFFGWQFTRKIWFAFFFMLFIALLTFGTFR